MESWRGGQRHALVNQPRQNKRHPGAPDQVQGGGGDVGKRAACHVAEKEFLAHAVDDERGQRHGDAAVAHVVQQVTHRPGQGGGWSER